MHRLCSGNSISIMKWIQWVPLIGCAGKNVALRRMANNQKWKWKKLFKCVSNLTTKRCGNESIWTNSRGFSFRSTSSENYLASWRIFMTSFGICLLMNNFRLHLFKINEKSGIGFDVIKISFERLVWEVKPLEWITEELVLRKARFRAEKVRTFLP